MAETKNNPLGTEPIGTLLARFAIPSIIAMLVSSLYNIVDQFFIGRSVGMLGNAATNVAFPLTITCTAISLLCGIGGAANFNLSMGKRERESSEICRRGYWYDADSGGFALYCGTGFSGAYDAGFWSHR